MLVPALSPEHNRVMSERSVGPVIKLVAMLQEKDPAKLETFRRESEALVADYMADNTIRQDFLLTRATKV